MYRDVREMSEVFLSHNSRDKPWVRELHQALAERGVTDVFLDEYAIDPGQRLVPALEGGLADTLMFILVWSGHAASSRWVAVERELALVSHLEGVTRRIVPIRVDDTPLPGFLKLFTHLTARTASTPHGQALPALADRLVRSLANARTER
jgi:hypothetical protein